jgi:hypothetical protein
MEIEILSQLELFGNHFNKEGNKNILFSAPFGYGKTYFLEKFFEKYSAKYRPFWLSPVKYVVSRNEDIFEYVKTDLALQLIKDEKIRRIKPLEFAEDIYLNEYLENEPTEAIRLLFELIKESKLPVVEQIAGTILKGFDAKDKYDKYKAKLMESQEGEYKKLYSYISSNTINKGSIFEDDIITQVIRGSLMILKEVDEANGETENRDNVLIIDDFDRLDPEHIFRILNILSVHQNYLPNEDKFGFDKIIIVCNVANVRSIYEHRYGLGADFEGYIEKFYSDDIFNFNNQLAISKYCRDILRNELSNALISLIGYYLSFFVEKEEISIRSIKKTLIGKVTPYSYKRYFRVRKNIFEIKEKVEYVSPHRNDLVSGDIWSSDYMSPIHFDVQTFYVDIADFSILEIISVLTIVFGDFKALKIAVDKYSNQNIIFPVEKTEEFINLFIPLIHYIKVCEDSDSDRLLWSVAEKVTQEPRYKNNIRINSYDLPTSSFASVQLFIPVGWNRKNQYTGEKSYYSNVGPIRLEDKDVSNVHPSLQGSLLPFLKSIINFIDSNGMLSALNVTK